VGGRQKQMETNNNHNSDRKELINFLNLTEGIINQLISDEGDFVLIVFARNKKYRKSIELAWNDARKKLVDVRDKFEQAELFPLEELKKVGLTGNQLQFKMDLLKKIYKTFCRRGSRLWLRRLLGSIDSVLGGLSTVFPTIEAVREIKDMIEQTLKEKKYIPKKTG
jgi:hypothetical protein